MELFSLHTVPCSLVEIFLHFDFGIRPKDSTVMVSLACGSLSGIASSTGEFSKTNAPFISL